MRINTILRFKYARIGGWGGARVKKLRPVAKRGKKKKKTNLK